MTTKKAENIQQKLPKERYFAIKMAITVRDTTNKMSKSVNFCHLYHFSVYKVIYLKRFDRYQLFIKNVMLNMLTPS